jgi:TrfA protein
MPFTPEQQEKFRLSKERVLKLAREREEKAEAKREICLPEWYGARRGTPNSFVRSALFAAIQSKDRMFLENAVLFSQENISVKFTGRQLNQEDLTIWQTLVELAKIHPLGNQCFFSASEILKLMGMSIGGQQQEDLRNSIRRLTACFVEITNGKRTYGGSLIIDFEIQEDTKDFCVGLNRKMIALFSDNDWTGIDWQQRLQLRGKPLTQALHAYYSTHQTPFPVKLSTLQELTGSRNKQAADFKRKCRLALDELVKVGFLENYQIDKNMVSVERQLV